MKILITGGAGYIGSTVASACTDEGHEVVVLDDFSTGKREFVKNYTVYEGDIADPHLLDEVFTEQAIDAVIHCAAKIIVPESVANPITYYNANVSKTISLLESMKRNFVNKILFSSSASIYDSNDTFVVTEESPLNPGSPYARTKMFVEMVLQDSAAVSDLKVMSLRYFNPIGTDPKMRSGQQLANPSHVLAKMMEAWQNNSTFTITGVNWPTRDGSGIRDYIHVWDLAKAHVAAINNFDKATATQSYQVFNIGTGNGITVRELVQAFLDITGKPLNVIESEPRLGDVAGVYTVSQKAHEILGWEAKLSVPEAIKDAIAWLPKRKELLGY